MNESIYKAPRNYSKLVKKLVIDKNGVKKMMWVKPDEGLLPKRKTLEDVNSKLHAKIKRKETGEGGEVKLSKDEAQQVLQYGKVGFVSAGKNPNDEHDMKLTDKEINVRHKELQSELTSKGYTFAKVHGKYGDGEDSFMVMANDIDRKDLITLGSKFNQDSVIYSEADKNEMIFTTGDHKGAKYKGGGFKELGKDVEDFYSEITTPAGSFRFSLNFDFKKLVKAINALFEKAKATDYGECDLDELITEHKRLVGVLASSSKEDDKRELKTQQAELKKLMAAKDEMKKEMPTDIKKGAKHFENLKKKTVIDKTGRKRTVWVKIGEAVKEGVKKVKEATTSRKKKEEDKYDTNKAASLFRRKMQGISQSIKHEVKEWKEAGLGIKKLVSGSGKLSDSERKAIKTVAIHAGIVVGLAMAGGATGVALGKGIGLGFLQHSGILRTAHALAFAKGEESDADDGSDAEAQHYIERLVMSMANYAQNHGKEEEEDQQQPVAKPAAKPVAKPQQ